MAYLNPGSSLSSPSHHEDHIHRLEQALLPYPLIHVPSPCHMYAMGFWEFSRVIPSSPLARSPSPHPTQLG